MFKRAVISKVIIASLLGILSIALSLGLALWITEKWFFDRVIYQKWSLYGYVNNDISYNLMSVQRLPWLVGRRLKSLRRLWRAVSIDTPLVEKYDDHLFKVALIGDSFVFGQGVMEGERISAVLERRLNAIRPTKVYTLAQLADDQMEYYANFRAAKKYLEPDLYIVSIVWNDFEVWGGKTPMEDEIRAELRAKCPKPERKEHFSPESSDWEHIIRDFEAANLSPEYSNACYMNEFIKEIQGTGKVIFFNFHRFLGPDWCEVGTGDDHVYHSWVMKEYERLINNNKGTIVGIDVTDWKNWQSVSEQEAHPGKKMHQQGADLLFKEITHNPKWKFMSPVEQ